MSSARSSTLAVKRCCGCSQLGFRDVIGSDGTWKPQISTSSPGSLGGTEPDLVVAERRADRPRPPTMTDRLRRDRSEEGRDGRRDPGTRSQGPHPRDGRQRHRLRHHVRRVFLRTGFADQDSMEHMVEVARAVHPERPGALDDPSWRIGKNRCHPRDPDCPNCVLQVPCARLIDRTLGLA